MSLEDVVSIYTPFVKTFHREIVDIKQRKYDVSSSSLFGSKWKRFNSHYLGYEITYTDNADKEKRTNVTHFICNLKHIPFKKGSNISLFFLLYSLQKKPSKGTIIPFQRIPKKTPLSSDLLNTPNEILLHDSSFIINGTNFTKKNLSGVFGIKLGKSVYVSDFPTFLPELKYGRDNVKDIYRSLINLKK